MESIPQMHLTLILMFQDTETIILGGDWSFGANFALFLVGFISSVISASLGMARLLLNGPSKILRKQGYLGGYLQVSFTLIFFSIMCVLVAKALWLALLILEGSSQGAKIAIHVSNSSCTLLWLGVSLLPQLIFVSFI